MEGEKELTDAEIAARIRMDLKPHIQEICRIINRAKELGLTVTFQLGPDRHGCLACLGIDVVRPL